MAEFADQAEVRIQAGDGGHGCASIHREKFKPLGGPDGGNGGRGGNVIIEVDPGTATLLEYHRRPLRRATGGKPGTGSNRNGADARLLRQIHFLFCAVFPQLHFQALLGKDHLPLLCNRLLTHRSPL